MAERLMVRRETHVDLFSGIGGFALAAQRAGLQTVQFVEIDKFCQKVLQKNFPGVPIHEDIKTFSYGGNSPYLLTGGPPCQPASCAGKRRGEQDDHWLWPEALRIVSELKPYFCLFENPTGILSLEGGLLFENLLLEMESQGYTVQAFIIPACAVGAPHRRDRVWILGKNAVCQGCTPKHSEREASKRRPDGFSCEPSCHVADTDRFNGDDGGYGSGEVSQLQEAEVCGGESITDPNPARSQIREMLAGNLREKRPAIIGGPWTENWPEVAARLCRVDDGVSDRVHRLKALGNAIVPQVAYRIIKAMLYANN